MHQTEIFLMKQIEKYKAQVERVRELHSKTENGKCHHCIDDYNFMDSKLDWEDYPCPTIKALDGEQ
jgi:hypothetical protein